MSSNIILTQIVMPIALLIWFAWFPAKGWLGYLFHIFATTILLLTIIVIGLWAFPPFWMPWVFVACLLGTVLWHGITGRIINSSIWLASRTKTFMYIGLLIFALYWGRLGLFGLEGRALPNVNTVNIAPPFGPGIYLVAHGGSTEAVNGHMRTLDTSVERYLPWRGQSRALDFIKITSAGFRVEGWRPVKPERYESFGVPLIAPCSGVVVLAQDGFPDMPVPIMDSVNKLGNYVAIDCGNFVIFMAHLREHTVRVSIGQHVSAGDPVGEIGNSGNSSEPHLHIHAQSSTSPLEPVAGEPLGLTINGEFLVRNNRLHVLNQ